MASVRKVLEKVLRARSDTNIRFADLLRLLAALGFDKRISGDHHICWRDGIAEIINLQPLPGGKAKPYQVRQVRDIVTRYGLKLLE